MAKDDFERARIIGKPESPTPDQKAPESGKTSVADKSSETSAPKSEAVVPGKPIVAEEGQSFDGILDRLTGKGKAVWESPFDMYQHGVFNELHCQTVDQMTTNIKGFVQTSIFFMHLLIGYYLLAVFFDNDETKVFTKNPYKDTSLNDLARRDDMPFKRSRLTDCISAAAVDMQLRKSGLNLDGLLFPHLLELSKVKIQEQRFGLAKSAHDEKLTPGELAKRVNELLGKKSPSQDKLIGKAITKQLEDMVRLSTDRDLRAFLLDRDRLRAAFSSVEIATVLEKCDVIRAQGDKRQRLIQDLENTLVEIQVENLQRTNP